MMTELNIYRAIMVCLVVAGLLFAVRYYGDYRARQAIQQRPVSAKDFDPWARIESGGSVDRTQSLDPGAFQRPAPRTVVPTGPDIPSSGYSAYQRQPLPDRPIHVAGSKSGLPADEHRGANGPRSALPPDRPSTQFSNLPPVPPISNANGVTQSESPAKQRRANDQAVREMMAIKKRLGGSQIAAILPDSSVDAEACFEQILADLISGSNQPIDSISSREPVVNPKAEGRANKSKSERPAPARVGPPLDRVDQGDSLADSLQRIKAQIEEIQSQLQSIDGQLQVLRASSE